MPEEATPRVLAPTLVEYLAARLVLGRVPVHYAGIGLRRWPGAPEGTPVVVCGLAGALVDDLPSGCVLIPEQDGLPDGSRRACDPDLVAALSAAARSLGYDVRGGALVTVPQLATGAQRARLAAGGFAAADMETALLPGNLRVATVRVILDTLHRPLSARWASPTAALHPDLWPDLPWLAGHAPAYAHRAARVVREGLQRLVL
ncbi:MAG TPA: hypothetical protein VFI42_12390 [Thermomicrobiaceae bacterium]|nr:hypothetical protein [Thermomicrobiaceae bacterium]